MTKRTPGPSAVTGREGDVLACVARHLTNAEIADELCVSVRTVESHVSSLMRKLDLTDRRALARHVESSRTDRADSPGRWPTVLTTFIGRDAECETLRQLVATHRMVTVTGPGGVGKTRLALQVAQDDASRRPDGGWFVDLAQVTDPAMVTAAVAATVGVVEQAGEPLEVTLTAALASRDALIVLDNCEHLLGAVRSCVQRLLTGCPSVRFVATSRARLVAPFEHVYVVPGLSVTDDGGDAVSLFAERATAAGYRFEDLDRQPVTTLCRGLEGIALAIELAACRAPVFGLDGLISGLDQRLSLLTSRGVSTDRHRSLAAAIGWSYDLLSKADRALLDSLSVFATWFDVGAAAAVAPPTTERSDTVCGLARLAEHNLVVVASGEPTRYRLLETIRQYGVEQLAVSGHQAAAHARHRRWCQAQLHALAGRSPDEEWCERFDAVADDIRSAIVWAARCSDAAAGDLAEQLAGQLFLRGLPAEAQRRYEQAARHAEPGAERARLLRSAAGAAASRYVGNDALRLLGEAAAEAMSAGDSAAAAEDLAWTAIYTRQAPGIIADVPAEDDVQRTLDEARRLAGSSPVARAAIAAADAFGDETGAGAIDAATATWHLARDANAPLLESVALDQLCACHLEQWRLGDALDALRRRGDCLDPLPLDPSTGFQFNDYLLMASEVHLAAGDLARAGHYADRHSELSCFRQQDHLAVARRIKVDAIAGRLDDAASRGERFLTAWERAGRPIARTLNTSTYAMAMVHGLLGDETRRRRWVDVTTQLVGDPARLTVCDTGWAPTMDALVALDRDQPHAALERLTADIDEPAVWRIWAAVLWRPWYAALWAEAAVLARHPDADTRLERSVAATSENPIATTIRQRAADLARGDHHAVAAHARTFAKLGCPYQQRRTERLATVGGRTGTTG